MADQNGTGTDILQPIVEAYQAAKASAPTATEYNRKKAITERYTASLDPGAHAALIEAAWDVFNQTNPPVDDVQAVRQTIKSIGRVLKNHGLIEAI